MSNERIESIIEREIINNKLYLLGEHDGHYHMMVHNLNNGNLLKEKNAHILDPNLILGVLIGTGVGVSVYIASHFKGPASWVAFAPGFYLTMGLLYFATSSQFRLDYDKRNFGLYKEFMSKILLTTNQQEINS